MKLHSVQMLAVAAALVVGSGCGNGGSQNRSPSGIRPEAIQIPATKMNPGFYLGVSQTPVSLHAFSITRLPISAADYAQCVNAGVCTAPDAQGGVDTAPKRWSTYSPGSTATDLPLTYATPKQAATYCGWVGGRLPRFAEWMLAARGSDVHRYSWGDDPPTCERGPRQSYYSSVADRCCGMSCDSGDLLKLLKHPKGRSISGMEDVLVSGAELVGPDADSQGRGCNPQLSGCLVYGLAPGAIDAMVQAPGSDDKGAGFVYDFRCAWDGGDQK
jgi:hypothetical protein